MNVLSLFSGIGGIDLGMERAGFTIIGQVEIDAWCRRVLAKHWPDVPRHDDVHTVSEWWYGHGPRPYIDVLCGGFPCQPISNAGKRLWTEDERWLWPATFDAVRAFRPPYVMLENVPAIRRRGLGDVLGDLASLRYDVQWDCVPASAIGANHQRDRWFALAYATRKPGQRNNTGKTSPDQPYAHIAGNGQSHAPQSEWLTPQRDSWWAVEPDVDRMAYGVPRRVDRIRGLGNAVVPQVAEHIGQVLIQLDRGR